MTAKASRRLRILLVLAAIFIAYRLTLRFMVQAKLNAIREQGYPVTLAELDKWYPQPPSGENAADLYREAFKQLAPGIPSDTNLPLNVSSWWTLGSQPLSTEVLTNIEAYLSRNAAGLALLQRIAAFDQCRYSIQWPNALEVEMQDLHLFYVRESARLLALQSVYANETGKSQEAVGAIVSGLRLAHSLKDEPFVFGQVTREISERLSLLGLRRMINRTTIPDQLLTQLTAAVNEEESSPAIQRAIIGDLCWRNAFFEISTREFSSFVCKEKLPRSDIAVFGLYRASGLMAFDQLSYLRIMHAYFNLCQKSSTAHANADEFFSTESTKLPQWLLFSKLIVSAQSGLWAREARAIVDLRTARTALAIERFRLSSGNLPDQLEKLVPTYLDVLPVDPFNGQALHYKKLAKGYVVYSIGKDLTDDGGDEKKDVAFTVER